VETVLSAAAKEQPKETSGASRGGDNSPTCGVIMPISSTSNQTEQHWSDVQKLLHRAISEAEFSPVNVWTNELTDRVSERIVGNIYSHDIVVADISDLNPNVMLELGLRLASKKPTIVVVNSGGTIPFDIRDFHAIHYPADLNILGMEEFFSALQESLKIKLTAYRNGTYTPFLGQVVVDVLSPETREVPLDELVLAKLDELGSRLGRLERQGTRANAQQSTPVSHWDEDSTIYLDIRTTSDTIAKQIEEFVDSQPKLLSFPIAAKGNYKRLRITPIDTVKARETIAAIRSHAANLGLDPSDVRFVVRSEPD
jgi:hypothetical protein